MAEKVVIKVVALCYLVMIIMMNPSSNIDLNTSGYAKNRKDR